MLFLILAMTFSQKEKSMWQKSNIILSYCALKASTNHVVFVMIMYHALHDQVYIIIKTNVTNPPDYFDKNSNFTTQLVF